MAVLISVEEFRVWAGVGDQVPDAVLDAAVVAAESGIAADTGEQLAAIMADPAALSIARDEALRRSNRLLARRLSPEGTAGAGLEGVITIPSRDPDSQRAIWAIQSIMRTPEGVA